MKKYRNPFLKGQICLVTGASGGIGLATARLLALHGADLVLVARNRERLDVAVAEIRASGGRAAAIPADLSSEAARIALIGGVLAKYGRIDVLVNNAGFGWYGYAREMNWETARGMLELNVTALVHLSLLVLDGMTRSGSGHIVNMSSIAGSLPEQGIALYGATKAFVDGFSTALHRETRGSGVRIGVVRPGAVQTEFFSRAEKLAASMRFPGGLQGIPAERVAKAVLSVLRRPRRDAYVPAILRLAPVLEAFFGRIIDRLGPFLLRKKIPQSQ